MASGRKRSRAGGVTLMARAGDAIIPFRCDLVNEQTPQKGLP